MDGKNRLQNGHLPNCRMVVAMRRLILYNITIVRPHEFFGALGVTLDTDLNDMRKGNGAHNESIG